MRKLHNGEGGAGDWVRAPGRPALSPSYVLPRRGLQPWFSLWASVSCLSSQRFAFPWVKGLCLPGNRVIRRMVVGISLVVQSVVKNPPSSAGTRVRSPLWEIRAHRPRSSKAAVPELENPCAATRDPAGPNKDLRATAKTWKVRLSLPLRAVWPNTNPLTSLRLSFLIFKMGQWQTLLHLVVVGKGGPVDQIRLSLVYTACQLLGVSTFFLRLKKKSGAEQYIVT